MNWTVCISNEGYAASLEPRKLYSSISDERAAARGMVRVVDESGESYLYPDALFAELLVPEVLEQRLLAA